MSDDREVFWFRAGIAALAALLFAALLGAGLAEGGSVLAATLLALAFTVVIGGAAYAVPLMVARRVFRPEREPEAFIPGLFKAFQQDETELEREPDGEWITEVDEWSARIAEMNGLPPELGPASRVSVSNLNGVPWHEALVPPRRHRCTPQTKGWVNYFTSVERCACGAIRSRRGDPWMERNSRKIVERPVR